MTSYWRQIGLVPQETLLFGGTIEENIRFAKEEATLDEIQEAARSANADTFINECPDGYQTIVGEKGIRLSAGQRQRIAIARAILKNPHLLILDEATSSLDNESEKLIQEALERLMQGKTSFVIAHRLSTIHNADKILVMDKGQIVETGTHQELMDHKGFIPIPLQSESPANRIGDGFNRGNVKMNIPPPSEHPSAKEYPLPKPMSTMWVAGSSGRWSTHRSRRTI